MSQQHSKEEILSVLETIEYATVATIGGRGIRTRMMHFSVDEDFNVYLASMKGDPKTLQITHNPSISLLMLSREGDISESKEIEFIGRALIVKDQKEREKAFRSLAKKSPVVKYLVEANSTQVLDVIGVEPEVVKYRIFKEIVKGIPPTVLQMRIGASTDEFDLMRRKMKSWVTEIRVPFLTATIIPILLGTAIAWAIQGTFFSDYFLLTLVSGLLLHAGTNVANDYFDYRSGNDEINREFVRPFSGGSRMIQLGLLSPLEVLSGALLFFLLGSILGLYLVWARGITVLLLGIIGVFCGFFYTAPPFDLASRGIGELLVGLNFGVLMTLGAFYVQAQSLTWEPVFASIPVSLLIAGVLYINEFPDYEADKSVGKNHAVVRLGREMAVIGYSAIMISTYLSIGLAAILGLIPSLSIIALLTIPLSVKAVRYSIKYHSKPFELAPANASTITIHLVTGYLLCLAYILDRLGTQGLSYAILTALLLLLILFVLHRYTERQIAIFEGLKKSVG